MDNKIIATEKIIKEQIKRLKVEWKNLYKGIPKGGNMGEILITETFDRADRKEVSPGIFRSARPTYEELKGFATILNLENDPEAIFQEEKWCKELGILYLVHEMSQVWPPDSFELESTIYIIKHSLKPLLIHCKHGHERTGFVVANYRRKVEKWSKLKAINESLDEGFSPFFIWWYI